MRILKKEAFTMRIFWIPLLVHGMMLAGSASLIKQGLLPWSMVEWRFSLLISLLTLFLLAFILSSQHRETAVDMAMGIVIPWLFWFAATLIYSLLQGRITFLPLNSTVFPYFGSYGAPVFCFLAHRFGDISCRH